MLGEAAPLAREDSSARGDGRRISTLPIDRLRPNPAQPRRQFGEEAIEELVASIRSRGLLQPILVRPAGEGAWEIVAGERRWRAAQRAGVHDVPVVVRELDDAEAAEIGLIENVQRVDLNPMEEAVAYARLAETHGRTQEEIATAVGKSRSHVANMMRLIALPEKCRKALEEGAISMGHARALLGAKDPNAALSVILKRGWNVRDTERFVRRLGDGAGGKKHSASTSKRSKDPDTRALEADLAAALGLEVSISHGAKGEGVLTIAYRSLDQLDDVCKRLMGIGV